MSHYEILINLLYSLNPNMSEVERQRKIKDFEKKLKQIMWPDSPIKSQHEMFARFKAGKVVNFKLEWIAKIEKMLKISYLYEVIKSNEQ